MDGLPGFSSVFNFACNRGITESNANTITTLLCERSAFQKLPITLHPKSKKKIE